MIGMGIPNMDGSHVPNLWLNMRKESINWLVKSDLEGSWKYQSKGAWVPSVLHTGEDGQRYREKWAKESTPAHLMITQHMYYEHRQHPTNKHHLQKHVLKPYIDKKKKNTTTQNDNSPPKNDRTIKKKKLWFGAN